MTPVLPRSSLILRFFARFRPKSLVITQECLTFASRNQTRHTAIKVLRNILRALAILLAAIATALFLLTETPWGQKQMARVASQQLSQFFSTQVVVKRVHVGLFNRLVLDDIFLTDQQDSLLLSAARLSAKVELRPLLNGKVRINNIQLFGYHAVLRRASEAAPYNFQFIADRFKKDDNEPSSPLDLNIGTVMIRRGLLEHHVGADTLSTAAAAMPFSPRHLRLDSLTAKISSIALTDSSISLSVNNLSFRELRSGLRVNDLHFLLKATTAEAQVNDFGCLLPHSEIKVPEVVARWEAGAPEQTNIIVPELEASLTPTDLQAFLPTGLTRQLGPVLSRTYQIKAGGAYDKQQLALGRLEVQTNGFRLDSRLIGRLKPEAEVHAEVAQLDVNEELLGALQPLLQDKGLAPLANLGSLQLSGWGDYKPGLVKADLNALSALGEIQLEGTLWDNDTFDAHIQAKQVSLAPLTGKSIALHDGNIKAQGSIASKQLKGVVEAAGFQWAEQRLALGQVNADIELVQQQLAGHVELADVNYKDTPLGTLSASGTRTDQGMVYKLQSGFMEAQVEGEVNPSRLVSVGRQMLHHTLPSLFPTPYNDAATATSSGAPESMRFDLHLTDVTPIAALTGKDVGIGQPVHASGVIDHGTGVIALEMQAPQITYGAEELTDLSLSAYEQADSISIRLDGKRQMAFGPLLIGLDAHAAADSLRALLTWDNQLAPSTQGAIRGTSHFFRDAQQKLGASIHFHPSQMLVSDTVWNIHPSDLLLHDGKIRVHDFAVSQLGRHLRVDGTVSKDEADTLSANLLGINLQYVFNLIDFHAVEFAGLATGEVKAHGLMKQPVVDADLRVNNFTLNDGLLGQLRVTGGWGRRGPKSIDLEGHITEPTHGEETVVHGLVTPGHAPGSGLDLQIYARRVNAYFVNFFTKDIFTDLEGSASGYAHLFGPFGQLDLEGALKLDTAALTLDVIGTRYHLAGDSLLFRPGRIIIPGAYVMDPAASTLRADARPEQATQPADIPIGHCGLLRGEVRHQNFSIKNYQFDILAREIQGYDFRDFGDQVFYGTVFASGRVRLGGRPGALNVDISCTPTAGTTFTYNASNPEISTDNAFIRFVQPAPVGDEADGTATAQPNEGDVSEEEEEPSDMHINFDLDINPDATMRILMDARSGDYITLAGNGHLRAHYYNKGAFQMYGTYLIDHGTYKLSLQDVIRKEFQIQQGSSITFGGAPMKGDLDLRAIYTVPSVSLNDLTVGSNFSNSSVRVNCIMNIGGRAEQPQVSFDFDIPNVNEDEKQMVRSLISTEEERNMQVIYLLGIGRFYTYGSDETQAQANSAVQSLLSSTLSGQLNEYLGRALGNTQHWNFGTNLSTGTMGWNDMDVEGMLSGRLLNNRLLLNGTFGYRDTPVANTNFIGDFDVQYLLTPNGTVSLKAYSETNDRYFTKMALTTQGVGIVLKKDFNNLSDLFRTRRNKGNKDGKGGKAKGAEGKEAAAQPAAQEGGGSGK